jgi:hypothetical protein
MNMRSSRRQGGRVRGLVWAAVVVVVLLTAIVVGANVFLSREAPLVGSGDSSVTAAAPAPAAAPPARAPLTGQGAGAATARGRP